MALVILAKSRKIAHQPGYYLYRGRWHRVTAENPAPHGAHVVRELPAGADVHEHPLVVPTFGTYTEGMEWAGARAKQLGLSMRRYTTTPEYSGQVYPVLERLYASFRAGLDAENAETGRRMQAAMADAGVSVGQEVSWSQVGAFMSAESHTGVVKLDKNGIPFVHLPYEIATAKPGGKLGFTRKVRWQPYMSPVAGLADAEAGESAKDDALQAAIDHLKEDASQPDMPAHEKAEDLALVEKLEAAANASSTPTSEAPPPSSTPNISRIRWDAQLLPAENTNARVHNRRIGEIRRLAEAGDIAGLEALTFGINTYAKRQKLLRDTAVAGLREDRPALAAVDDGAHAAATSPHNDHQEPTPAQIDAGNYRKGHISVHGLDVTIENPRGSERSGFRADGSEWRTKMSDHYGYVKRSSGADGDHVDVFVGPHPESKRAFVVDQVNQQTGKFDEHKVLLGYSSQEDAVAAYRRHYDPGWKVGPVTELPITDLKVWIRNGGGKEPLSPDFGRVNSASALPDGTTIRDGAGQLYRVHSHRNHLVVAHPIIDGKAAVSADTSVRFWVTPDLTPSGDNDRTDPIFVADGAGTLAKADDDFQRQVAIAEVKADIADAVYRGQDVAPLAAKLSGLLGSV